MVRLKLTFLRLFGDGGEAEVEVTSGLGDGDLDLLPVVTFGSSGSTLILVAPSTEVTLFSIVFGAIFWDTFRTHFLQRTVFVCVQVVQLNVQFLANCACFKNPYLCAFIALIL